MAEDVKDPGPATADKILDDLEGYELQPTEVARQARRLRAHIAALRKLNLNDNVLVKLTPRGLAILREQHEAMNKSWRRNDPFREPEVDDDGWTKVQLWTLFQDFGQHVNMACDLPFETTIRLPA